MWHKEQINPSGFFLQRSWKSSVLMAPALPEGFALELRHKYSVHRRHTLNSLSKPSPKVCYFFSVCVTLLFITLFEKGSNCCNSFVIQLETTGYIYLFICFCSVMGWHFVFPNAEKMGCKVGDRKD